MREERRKSALCHYVMENKGDRLFRSKNHMFISYSKEIGYLEIRDPGQEKGLGLPLCTRKIRV